MVLQQTRNYPPNSSTNVNISDTKTATQDNDGEIVLGEKRPNPYSLKNMETALKELQKTNEDFAKIKLEATHVHVKIESETEEAFLKIQDREDIDLYRYPLDYEVKKSGKFYREAGSTNKFQTFWAVVPVDYVFEKELSVKTLEQLILPLGNGNPNLKGKEKKLSDNASLLEELEQQAISMFDTQKSKKGKITSNYISGNIRVWDDYKQQYIPLPGLTVKAKRSWATFYSYETDANGYYSINYGFSGPADVTIVYENQNFKLRLYKYIPLINGLLTAWNDAETSKNNVTGSWSPYIIGTTWSYGSGGLYFSPDAFRLAHAFRATYDYFYKHPSTYGITPPPFVNQGSILGYSVGPSKLTLGVTDFTVATQASHTWVSPTIQGGNHLILRFVPSSTYTSAGNYTALDMYGTTIHELSHAKHFAFGMTRNGYMGSKKCAALAEAYALAMEYRIVMDEYNIKNTSTWHANIKANREYDYRDLQVKLVADFNGWTGVFPVIFDSAYTPFFIDMIDNSNQYNIAGSNIDDYMYGTSASTIEQAVKNNPEDWNGARNYMKTNIPYFATKIDDFYNIYSANK